MDELKDKTVETTPADKTRTDYVNGIYDSQIAAQKQELENAYNQNVTAQQRANDKIGTTYQTNANQFAVDAERNRRNFNMQAAMNGLNTGAGSQANLAQNASYNNGMQSIRTAQADAVTAGEQAMADIQTQYQNEIAAAIANNDYQRATALYEAWNNDKADKENKAALLANYGDFSGYAELYGQSQASAMEKVWIASNPDLAYKLGKIDANKYYSMTGKWPAGYSAPSYGGDYYGGGGSGNQFQQDLADLKANGASDALINSYINNAVKTGVQGATVQAAKDNIATGGGVKDMSYYQKNLGNEAGKSYYLDLMRG